MSIALSSRIRLSVFGLVLAACSWAWAESTLLDLSISADSFSEWGGKRIVGEMVEQGADNGHVKLTFRSAENPQRKEMGVILTPDLPEFNKVTMEVFSNVDTSVRVRLEDASHDPFIVKVPVTAGAWTPVEYILDKKSGKNWPPKPPYRNIALLAIVAPGSDEQVLEIKNVQLIKE